ncbi:MAG TPA: SDR family NAD(P)-dependent oxidoreductase [Cytophagaceae bacterium]|jgi:NADP-dependent 3-hydroxy acid dehydrogenase YdfG
MEVNSPIKNRALISGGNSGIGLAIAKKFVANNIPTAVADLDTGTFSDDNLRFFKCDVTSGADIAMLFGALHDKDELPNILVCNAGQGIHEKLTEGDPEKWLKIIEVNLLGALRLIRAFVPPMLKAGSGDVVIISSAAAGRSYEYGGVYSATKSALETIANTLRIEVQPSVRVTVVAPGVTDTNFFKNAISGSHTIEDIGWGAISPTEVADNVFYAVSRPPEVSINYLSIRPVLQPF